MLLRNQLFWHWYRLMAAMVRGFARNIAGFPEKMLNWKEVKSIHSMMNSGYDTAFLGVDDLVDWPIFPEDQIARFALRKDMDSRVLDYGHYSVMVDKHRRFPAITASNISGPDFKPIARKTLFGGSDRWVKDRRIDFKEQWGSDLYAAKKSDFDRGHMTKREDVQWGCTEEAADAARSTFFYTNSIPQHKDVNRSIWRSIEDYVLKKETVLKELKINVFTGPVLEESDPHFVTKVKDVSVQLPTIFWKVIYYISKEGELSRVAFMVGQKYLLEKYGIVKRYFAPQTKRAHFMNFKYADTYQVNVSAIEEITDWLFPPARDSYYDERPTKLVLEKVQVVRSSGVMEEQESGKLVGLVL